MNLLSDVSIANEFYTGQPAGVRNLTSSPGSFISAVLPNIMILAGVIFFGLILIGGFGMVIGAGKESSPQAAAKSKSAVTYGVIGFLLVISAYFILQIVSTLTGVPFLTLPNF